MVLLGGIDQVEIDGKSANYIDGGIQITLAHNAQDLLLHIVNLLLDRDFLGIVYLFQTLTLVAQADAKATQLLYCIKDLMAFVPLNRLPQCVAQDTYILSERMVFFSTVHSF
ncbi:hypothetical protein KDAU_13190 [Dictyobacter aurantiacus]|uniref:Uncharacterized protein n=1 Tax=Dictyobacter aurantiacus TaxID=1936993 RepID=A0A401ZAT7_9CHLR|nr:hypothetical protein KDAU_13190 [Dictyobacter aurantiacus]